MDSGPTALRHPAIFLNTQHFHLGFITCRPFVNRTKNRERVEIMEICISITSYNPLFTAEAQLFPEVLPIGKKTVITESRTIQVLLRSSTLRVCGARSYWTRITNRFKATHDIFIRASPKFTSILHSNQIMIIDLGKDKSPNRNQSLAFARLSVNFVNLPGVMRNSKFSFPQSVNNY